MLCRHLRINDSLLELWRVLGERGRSNEACRIGVMQTCRSTHTDIAGREKRCRACGRSIRISTSCFCLANSSCAHSSTGLSDMKQNLQYMLTWGREIPNNRQNWRQRLAHCVPRLSNSNASNEPQGTGTCTVKAGCRAKWPPREHSTDNGPDLTSAGLIRCEKT